MMKVPVNDSTEFELCPAGSHVASCAMVIDIGTQKTNYKGKDKSVHKVWIGFSTCSETMETGEPFLVGSRYTLSLNEKALLRKHLESWRGAKYKPEELVNVDLRNILKRPCLISVVHSENGDRVYANIEGLNAIPKGTPTPSLEMDTVYLSLKTEDYEPSVFDSLPEWLKETIMKSPEWQAIAHPHDNMTEEEAADAGIPF